MDEQRDDATPFEVIHSYSRTEALDDGVLVDVTEPARETGFRYPVALTHTVWQAYVALSPAARRAGNDERGRLHDILSMLRCAIRCSSDGPELAFEILCVTTSQRPSRVSLRAVVGPGDHHEPVITVMMPDES